MLNSLVMNIYRNSKVKGFTLIELLVVIAIIGILATIILSEVSKSRDRALMTSYKSTLVNIRTALEVCAGTGGELYGGVRHVGDDICNSADTVTYPPFSKKCGNINYIVNPGTGYDWTVTSSATCGGCRLVCDVDGCTAAEGDCGVL